MLLTAGVVIIVFFISSFLPAHPAIDLAGQRSDSTITHLINHDFALDQPAYIRFLIYVNDLLPLSVYNRKVKDSPIYLDPAKYKRAFKMFYFGSDKAIVFKSPYLRRSFQSKEAVYDVLKVRFNDSLVLMVTAILLSALLGVLLGIISGLNRLTWIGKTIHTLAVAGISFPVFFVAIVTAWLFGFILHRFTGLNMSGALYSIDPFEGEYINWKNLVLPALVLALRPMSLIALQARNRILKVMNQPHILAAKAKGLRKFMIIFNHAWLNTAAPIVILSDRWLGALLTGMVFVEFVFGWNGIGRLAVTSIVDVDLPVVMGIVLFAAVVYILLKLFTELLYSTLDPRVDPK